MKLAGGGMVRYDIAMMEDGRRHVGPRVLVCVLVR
jgi:hypothetical protein